MKYDIKIVEKWEAPDCDGAPILCMPNIPLPMHGMAPRTLNPKRWEYLRKKCYMDAKYTCQASGEQLGHGRCHAHEMYNIDWANQTMTFRRAVCISPDLHTKFIHSGRALTLFEKGDPIMTQTSMIKAMQRSFSLIHDWNIEHSDDESLRVYAGILSWAKNPELKQPVEKLAEAYNIKFYDFDWKCFDKEHWGNWKLLYNNREYPTQYKTQADWEIKFNPNITESKKETLMPNSFAELDELIKEV